MSGVRQLRKQQTILLLRAIPFQIPDTSVIDGDPREAYRGVNNRHAISAM